ncbi:hypothetical protein [Burkholderia lata]|uniref:Uncharacterized protein n=1 Tax=Burkholderia lata (strain ATCC 17760 / DSM 23089 / LMG 22485 / NCIMB 9086 / R18194 / 383) TaxID=482957 RepID=A0A6P2GR02_BURL3|nr:hypothetical protein [Burkholderia lata]VWB06933.1 hypothetical protein BLA6863_00141 [Burkholderia lata]
MQIEYFPYQPSALGNFILNESVLDATVTGGLSTVVPAYVYGQFSDDFDIQAFFSGLNTTAQGYCDWFQNTPLSVYTNANINGPLLDWVGQGLYGISRPVLSTLTTRTIGQVNSVAANSFAVNRHFIIRSGTVSVADDDIYKRVLTWHLYLGDGRQMSVQWMKRRIARFLFGADGSDIPVDYLRQIGITQPNLPPTGATGSVAVNTAAVNTIKARSQKAARTLQITIPNSSIGQAFQILLSQGYLAVPFQVTFTVVLQS